MMIIIRILNYLNAAIDIVRVNTGIINVVEKNPGILHATDLFLGNESGEKDLNFHHHGFRQADSLSTGISLSNVKLTGFLKTCKLTRTGPPLGGHRFPYSS